MKRKEKIHPSAFIADGAKIIGTVTIGENSSVWYNCVIRSDYNDTEIIIGKNTNIQDGTIVHLDSINSTIVGDNVTIGHNCIIHGCSIEDGALIGMGSTILNRAKIGSNTIIAAGSVVKENAIVEANALYAGIPARKIKSLSTEKADSGRRIAKDYIELAKRHKENT